MISWTRMHALSASGNEAERANHGIVYTGRTPPSPLPEEGPSQMCTVVQPVAVRVDPDELGMKLEPTSRINCAHPYTIDHRHRVKNIGRINHRTMAALLAQWHNETTGEQTFLSQISTAALFQPTEEDEQVYSKLVSSGWSHERAAQYINSKTRRQTSSKEAPRAKKSGETSNDSEDNDGPKSRTKRSENSRENVSRRLSSSKAAIGGVQLV